MEEIDKYSILIDPQEYQRKVLDCITSDEVNKFFDATIFKDSKCRQECKQAMIHGMAIASMMTSNCTKVFVKEGHQ